jgi:metal-dependent amidase/aminoacylase/carboxypeptidase family protein
MVSLLHFHGNKLSHGQLQKLAITMAKQACDYRATVKETGDDVEWLEKELSDIRIAEAQALGNDPPKGYVANDNHLPAFLIPDSMGVYGVAQYVRLAPTKHQQNIKLLNLA